MTKRQEFGAALAVLASAFNRELTPPGLEGYWIALGDLEQDHWRTGIARSLREWTGKFMPTPPELRQLALGQTTGDGRRLNAANAWEVVRAAMTKYDYTRSVDFGPLTNAVVRNMGGWLWLCDRTIGDLTFDRKKFEELHVSLSTSHLSAERSAPLPGKFGGEPVLFQIPGEPERRLAIADVETPFLSVLRGLAEKKAATG